MNKIITLRNGMNNCFVLCGETQAILVDTCLASQRKQILNKIKDYPIKLIILTHGHYDHIENAAHFANHFGAKIAMHKNDYELSKDNSIHQLHVRTFMGKVIRNFSKSNMQGKKDAFEPDFFLEDGDSLAEYGIDAKIVLLQGHTQGSVGIKSHGKGFIVGDTLMNITNPTVSLLAEDFIKLEQSVELLRHCGSEIFYVGHGKPIMGKF